MFKHLNLKVLRTVTSFKIEKKTFETKDVMQILETGLSSFVKELFFSPLQLGFSSFVLTQTYLWTLSFSCGYDYDFDLIDAHRLKSEGVDGRIHSLLRKLKNLPPQYSF